MINWVASGSLGLLVGLLVGLSTSPVVNTAIAALLALVGGVFGLSDKLPGGINKTGAHKLAAFSLFFTVAMIGGVLLRTYGVLGPSVAHLKGELNDIGVTSDPERKDMLKFIRYGILPAGSQVATEKQDLPALKGLLYSESASFCSEYVVKMSSSTSAEDFLMFMKQGGEAAKHMANAIGKLPAQDQSNALKAAYLHLCGQ